MVDSVFLMNLGHVGQPHRNPEDSSPVGLRLEEGYTLTCVMPLCSVDNWNFWLSGRQIRSIDFRLANFHRDNNKNLSHIHIIVRGHPYSWLRVIIIVSSRSSTTHSPPVGIHMDNLVDNFFNQHFSLHSS